MPERRPRQHLLAVLALALLVALTLLMRPAWANEGEVNLERTAEGLFLSVRQPLELGPALEEVLHKAVPVYFTYQAEVLEPRWYWADRRVVTAARTLRLGYQPLTRRWRLSVATGLGLGGMQYALHLNFDSLSEALASVGRVARWKIADADLLDSDERYRVDYRFRLDLSLLPRPFQIGMANQPDWNIERELRLEAGPLKP